MSSIKEIKFKKTIIRPDQTLDLGQRCEKLIRDRCALQWLETQYKIFDCTEVIMNKHLIFIEDNDKEYIEYKTLVTEEMGSMQEEYLYDGCNRIINKLLFGIIVWEGVYDLSTGKLGVRLTQA